MHGHFWTIRPFLTGLVKPARLPRPEPWRGASTDGAPLTGWLHAGTYRPDDLVMLVHGLGGCADSGYVRRVAGEVLTNGAACLRLNLRGADRRGADLYHAALTEDLHGALAHPALARYARVHLLGFSLGGHVSLRFAAEEHDPRIRGVASVCAPLDLAATQRALDAPRFNVYRRHVLAGLKDIYGALDPERAPTPHAEVLRVGTLRDWDRLTVVPRYGFSDVDAYYARSSAGPLLGGVRCRTLVVAAQRDPMIPVASLRRFLEPAPPGITARLVDRGGHVGFPPRVRLGLGGGGTWEAQVVRWLLRG